MATKSEEVPKVTGLNIFPIKSCKGYSVKEITVDKYGVRGDRRLMLVDGKGRFISQRRYASLATVSPVWEDHTLTRLRITAPTMDTELIVNIDREGERKETTIWNDTVMTIDQGEEASKWFSNFLGIPGNYIRLVASAEGIGTGYHRPLNAYYPDVLKQKLPLMQTSLADCCQLTVISNESLSDLNERMKEQTGGHTVPLNRFRMNIELTGCGHPFEEDEWFVVQIGSVPIILYSGNSRCKVPAINQETGETDKLGPLEILRQYRAPGGPGLAMFGQLGLALQTEKEIKIGDTVTVLEKKK